MLHFTAIPLTDIKNFLSVNSIQSSTDPYKEAWQLISTNSNILVPESIADFFIASNLVKDNIPVYKLSKIVSHNFDRELPSSLQNLSKKRVIKILKSLNKLDNDLNIFDILPQDISKIIIDKLDIHSIRLICEISQNFANFCRLHLQPLLKQNLKCSTTINIDNYNLKQLLHLCKSHQEPNIVIKYYRSLILKNGMIYKDDKKIFDLDDIIQLTVSDYHGMLLTSDGEVYAFGKNNYGQLGLGHHFDCEIPQLVPNIYDITSISVSSQHSMLLTAEGNVYVTQNFVFSLLDKVSNIVQISAGNEHSLLLSADNNVYIYQDGKTMNLLTDKNIKLVSTGSNHSLLLDKDGLVYCYGNNRYGQLGLGTKKNDINRVELIPNLTNIVYIIAGSDYSLVLNKQGQAFEFGLKDGQINMEAVKIEIPELINI